MNKNTSKIPGPFNPDEFRKEGHILVMVRIGERPVKLLLRKYPYSNVIASLSDAGQSNLVQQYKI